MPDARPRPASTHRPDPSAGPVGDSGDGALAEWVLGRFKTEAVNLRGPWSDPRDVERQRLRWIDRHDIRRLRAPIGCVPPAEAGQVFCADPDVPDRAA